MEALWLDQIEFWHWWALGVVLSALEFVVPRTVLIWTGVSAGITGLIKLLAPAMGWGYQLLIFAAFAVVTVSISLLFLRRRPLEPDEPNSKLREE